MKRSILFLILCISTIALTGCVKEEEYKPKTDRGTTTTTKKVEVETKEDEQVKINESVSYHSYITTNNDVAVIIKNNSDKTLDITTNIKYLSASNKSLGNDQEKVHAIKPNKETVVIFDDNDEWDTYEIKLDNKISNKVPVYDNIKYNSKTTKKYIEIEVTNYSKEPIDGISFSIAYYNDENELIDFVRSDTISIEENVTGIVNIDYPKNKHNRKMSFNRYVIYVNEVYKNKETK